MNLKRSPKEWLLFTLNKSRAQRIGLGWLIRSLRDWNELWTTIHQSDSVVARDGRVSATEQDLARMADDIIAKLDLPKQTNLLDIGCGTGMIASLILERCPLEYLGMDFINQAAKEAHARTGKNTLTASATSLPIRSDSVDAVLMYGVLLLMKHKKTAQKVLMEISRVLRKDGVALIGDVPMQELRSLYKKKQPYWIWLSEDEIKTMANSANLDPQIVEQNSLPFSYYRKDVVLRKK